MNRPNPLREKSFAFALDIVKFCRFLMDEKKEYILSKQLMRSGTSIGANVVEALNASTTKDFIYKLSIALKEAHETQYWILLIKEGLNISTQAIEDLFSQSKEIIALLTSIIKTSRVNLTK